MSEGRGLRRALTVDSVDLRLPSALQVSREIFVTDTDTDGDSIRHSRVRMAGLPLLVDRYTFSMPYPTSEDSELDQIREIQSEFGQLQFGVWKPMKANYIATQGQTDFYIPRRRRNAASVFSETEATYPFTCSRNGTAQTVVMVTGSTVSVPASGTCNVARSPATTGDRIDEVIFKLSACTKGDVIRIQCWPAVLVRLVAAGEDYPGGFREERSIVFRER